MKGKLLVFILVLGVWTVGWLGFPQLTRGQGPIIATGEQRRQIAATPILERPNRPLHVYGNTVRRRYHRRLQAPRNRAVPRALATRAP